MWRCKHVADALARYHYWDLPWARRLGLKLHVYLCAVCGPFHRQVMLMQDTAHHFHEREQADDPALRIPMPPVAKDRLRARCAAATRDAPRS